MSSWIHTCTSVLPGLTASTTFPLSVATVVSAMRSLSRTKLVIRSMALRCVKYWFWLSSGIVKWAYTCKSQGLGTLSYMYIPFTVDINETDFFHLHAIDPVSNDHLRKSNNRSISAYAVHVSLLLCVFQHRFDCTVKPALKAKYANWPLGWIDHFRCSSLWSQKGLSATAKAVQLCANYTPRSAKCEMHTEIPPPYLE